jgi:hypothetical protein
LNQDLYQDIREEIIKYEHILLGYTNFTFHYLYPYDQIIILLKLLKISNSELCLTTYQLSHHIMPTSLHLHYSVYTLSIIILYISSCIHHISIQSICTTNQLFKNNSCTYWYQLFSELKQTTLLSLCEYILQLPVFDIDEPSRSTSPSIIPKSNTSEYLQSCSYTERLKYIIELGLKSIHCPLLDNNGTNDTNGIHEDAMDTTSDMDITSPPSHPTIESKSNEPVKFDLASSSPKTIAGTSKSPKISSSVVKIIPKSPALSTTSPVKPIYAITPLSKSSSSVPPNSNEIVDVRSLRPSRRSRSHGRSRDRSYSKDRRRSSHSRRSDRSEYSSRYTRYERDDRYSRSYHSRNYDDRYSRRRRSRSRSHSRRDSKRKRSRSYSSEDSHSRSRSRSK